MVIINFLDGESIEIYEDTVLNGYNKSPDDGKEFYLSNVYTDSINGQFSKEGSRLSTVNPKIGIIGFILSVDCFSIGFNTEDNIVYLSSAVKSVENSTTKHFSTPSIHGVSLKR